MVERKWEPDILNELVIKSGKTYEQIADDAGIGRSTFAKAMRGQYPPSADILVALADYFGVTIDFLCGRNVNDDADVQGDVWTQYPTYFNWMLRCGYEKSIQEKRMLIPGEAIAVWPYNLLEEVFQEQIQFVLSKDQEDGLNEALNMLTPREKECLIFTYKDGLSFQVIGSNYHITGNRVMQIVHKGVRKLRHPARMRLIQDGLKGHEAIMDELQFISAEKRRLLRERAELEEFRQNECVPEEERRLKRPIEEVLEILSVRSTNCLRRADINTLGDLLNRLEEGTLFKVRNFGCKCVEEVVGKLYHVGAITKDDAFRYCELNHCNDEWLKKVS